ncbi:FAD-binding oxidoreductase [Cerasicoccus maritimus]|uniref:FAD-binding oxidoreductase n=1 Tax=Cerasicoccus maritimus TaxID=490089 RepID=UPI0028526F64|nr:FAD-linked oxidase C-terminal domain-containing protein [Cerasicoccus maritimus]
MTKKSQLARLRRNLGDAVSTSDEDLARCSLDSARLPFRPDAVVRPQTDDQLQKLLVLANDMRVPLTPRGAGSATTGAVSPVKGGWVLDMTSWDAIHIDATAGMAHVGAGAVTKKINDAAEAKGWFYPPDPSSLKYCTIGGNIATNAGGLRGAKYGVTRDYIYALEGFLPTGEPVRWGAPLKKFASGFNLRDLWIGSEGMLGVVTRATLKLIPKPQARWTCLAAFQNETQALRAVKKLLAARVVPSILEFLDRQSVDCAQRRRGAPFFPKLKTCSLLLLELDGHPAAVRESKQIVQALFKERALGSRNTTDPEKAETLWEARRTCSQAMFQMGDTKLNEDIVVPIQSYEALLRYTLELKKETGLATPTFGHVADGNFHVHLMYDHGDPDQCTRAEVGLQKLMEKVVELGGAITGEHGIGLAKSPFMPLQHTKGEIAAMQRIKDALDPNGILNPGKMFDEFIMWRHPRDYAHTFPWDHR